MVEVTDKVVSCSKSVGLVTDHLGFVVESLDNAVIDGHVELVIQGKWLLWICSKGCSIEQSVKLRQSA